MRKRHKFPPEFKSRLVLQLLSGEKRMAQLCRDYRLTSQLIGNRQQQFLAAAPPIFEKGNVDSAEQARITEPERIVGR